MNRLPRPLVSGTFILAALICLDLPNARADFFLHRWEDQFGGDTEATTKNHLLLSPNLLYFTTNQNYGPTGISESVPSLSSLSRIETDFLASYGFTENFSAFARLTWGRIEMDQTSGASSVAYGPMDQTVGFNLRAVETQSSSASQVTAIDLQFQVDFPAYSNTTATANNVPFLGDGSVDISAGAFLSLPVLPNTISRMKLVGGAAYTYRTQQFSAAVPWSIRLLYQAPADGLTAELSASGLESLRTDPHGTETVNSTVTSSGTGGSFIANAINPSLLTLRAGLGYHFGEGIGFWGAIEKTVWGQASPDGVSGLLGIQARLNTTRETVSDSTQLIPKDYGHSNQGYVNYSLDAKVTQAVDRMNLVKIDRGSQDGVENGQYFDLFVVNAQGQAVEAIARARVTSVHSNEAVLTVVEYFKEVWINAGFAAKRVIQ